MWYLFACVAAQGSVTCMPPQPMETEAICRVLAREYKATAIIADARAVPVVRCVTINRIGGSEESLPRPGSAPTP